MSQSRTFRAALFIAVLWPAMASAESIQAVRAFPNVVPPSLLPLSVSTDEAPLPGGSAVFGAVAPVGPLAQPFSQPTGPAPLPPTPSSPPVAQQFAAADYSFSIPPDTMGAASEDWLLVTLNDTVQYQSRAGAVVGATTLEDFFSPLNIADAFDPKVIYDSNTGRFYFVACADRRSGDSAMVLAVSTGSDPTGAWDYYHFDGDASDQNWVDYPNIGINGTWFAFSANMFGIVGDAFAGVNLWAVDLDSLIAGGPAQSTLFFETGVGGTLVPAQHYDDNDSTLHIVNTVNPFTGSIALHSLTGTGPNPSFNGLLDFVDDQPWNDAFPDSEQSGGADAIDSGDDRGMNAVVRDGSLWFTHAVAYPATGTATHVASRWYELDPATGTILQRGDLEDPAASLDYIYPSIAVNEDGAMMLGFSFSSSSIHPSAGYAFRAASDPPGTLQSTVTLKAGEQPYELYLSGTRNRWGDYSATMVDPLDGTSFWTLQEYADSPANTWGTWWGRVTTACACADVDGDGHYPTSCGDATCGDLDDCDDGNAATHPLAQEACDGEDNDCDGALDAPLGEVDADGDSSFSCEDCDDSDASVQDAQQEVCNNADDDCDGLADEEVRISSSGTGSIRVPPIGTSGTTTLPIPFSALATVVDVDLNLSVQHGRTSDLRFTLRSPSGTSVILSDGNGAGVDIDDLWFDDEGVGPITSGSNPFTGRFTPEHLLSAFDGEPAAGDWSLIVFDQSIGTSGSVTAWSLSIGYDGASDVDRDGAVACVDCDDNDATSFPGNVEVCDGVDNDCAPATPEGDDGDGDSVASCAGDCDDDDDTVFPGAAELCDGLDNDCDGIVPAFDTDADGDLVPTCDGDCDDGDDTIRPGASEACDGVDSDCLGLGDEVDDDGDAVLICDGDCDDSDPTVVPGAAEVCDGVDQDCDGSEDEAISVIAVGEGGLAVPETGTAGTTTSVAAVLQDGVVLDANVQVHISHGAVGDLELRLVAPSGAEVVLVQNEGGTGDHFTLTTFDDEATVPVTSASPPFSGAFRPVQALHQLDGALSGGPWSLHIEDGSTGEAGTLVSWVLTLSIDAGADLDGDGVGACTDCDDQDPDVAPGQGETCDGTDEDCSGVLSDDEIDGDGDGAAPCEGDCDDDDNTIGPDAEELCNGIDDRCSGGAVSDELDEDGDLVRVCDGDCDDLDDRLFPGNAEICDGVDQDCDGLTPGEVDADGDTFLGCGPDCDDDEPTVYDGAPEFCDGLDQNCDGEPEDEDEIVYLDWFLDGDGDGFGDPARPWPDNPDCLPPEGYVVDRTDCDDSEATAFPGGLGETGVTCIDEIDNDCDGAADRADEHCAALLAGDVLAPGLIATCAQAPGTASFLAAPALLWMLRRGRRRGAAVSMVFVLTLMVCSARAEGAADAGEDESSESTPAPPADTAPSPAPAAPAGGGQGASTPAAEPTAAPPIEGATGEAEVATADAAGNLPPLVIADQADIGRTAVEPILGKDAPIRLQPVPRSTVLYGTWIFGGQLGPLCEEGNLAAGVVADELELARQHVTAGGWFAARATVEELRPRLPCVGAVLEPDKLFEIHRTEAIGNFRTRGGFPTIEAIQRAVAIRADLQLDPSWPAEFGKVWLDVVRQRQATPPATVQSFGGDEGKTGEAWLNGVRLTEKGHGVMEGEHLLQVRGSDGRIHGRWVQVRGGDLLVVGEAANGAKGLRGLPSPVRERVGRWIAGELGTVDLAGVYLVDGGAQVAVLVRGLVVATNRKGERTVRKRSQDAVPRFSMGIGGGWTVLSTFHYAHAGLDLGGRIVGPLRVEGGVRAAFGARSESPIDGATRVPVLVPFGVGLGLRIPAKVRPFVSVWFQGAVVESGSEASRLYGVGAPVPLRTFLPGILGRGGVEIPLGKSPLDVRPFVEGGVLGTMPTLRAGLALGIER